MTDVFGFVLFAFSSFAPPLLHSSFSSLLPPPGYQEKVRRAIGKKPHGIRSVSRTALECQVTFDAVNNRAIKDLLVAVREWVSDLNGMGRNNRKRK